MNPDTGELRCFPTEPSVEDRASRRRILEKEGFLELPDELQPAARKVLGDKDSAMVSLTSGGKLSKWAAKKRRQQALQLKTAEACKDHYAGLI